MASTNKTPNLELSQWDLSDKPEMADFNNDFSKIDTVVATHLAESAYWKRVDTLSVPVEITSTDYANPTIVPLSEPYGTGSISKGIVYAVELASSYDFRGSQLVFFVYSIGGSAGGLMIGATEGARQVNRIRVPGNDNAIGFYGATGTMYVRAVYKVKEVEF